MGRGGGQSLRKKVRKGWKKTTKKDSTTWAWKFDPETPYSVEWGGVGAYYKRSVIRVCRQKLQRHIRERENIKMDW